MNLCQYPAITQPHVNNFNGQSQLMAPLTNKQPRIDTNIDGINMQYMSAVAITRAGTVPTPPSHNIVQTHHLTRNRRCVKLWTPEDNKRPSTQQCCLFKHIETFPASSQDVGARGRNRLLDISQIGIRCIHCKNLPQEGLGRGSSYFPAFVKSIYQSAQFIVLLL